MEQYGVTKHGFVLKRADEILAEMQADLKRDFGIDVTLNPQSLLNVLTMNFVDQISELWEIGQESYYSKYPSTAENRSLDNAVQYGGIRRKASQPNYYPIHCTGVDGTLIRKGAIVAADTKPQINLSCIAETVLTREKCNEVAIRVLSAQPSAIYAVTINEDTYSFSSGEASGEEVILDGLKAVIVRDGYQVEVLDGLLVISDQQKARESMIKLSSNLTTSYVVGIVTYATETNGKLEIPSGAVSKIVTNVNGLMFCNNILSPTYGREREEDWELRQAYISKIFVRSNSMLESIEGAILEDTDAKSATGYENDSDVVDVAGRPPHSIEMIVDGGNEADIAKIIFEKKAGGIQTCGDIINTISGRNGEPITVRFNRPEYVYAWIKVVLEAEPSSGNRKSVPTNYKELAKQEIMDTYSGLGAGDPFVSQLCYNNILGKIHGIWSVSITCFTTTDASESPGEYAQRNINVIPRQKIVIEDQRIDVSLVDTEGIEVQ